jgi:hypothetical protein
MNHQNPRVWTVRDKRHLTQAKARKYNRRPRTLLQYRYWTVLHRVEYLRRFSRSITYHWRFGTSELAFERHDETVPKPHDKLTPNKAHQLSKVDSSVTPPTTTTPDDVFFILQNVLTRLISTASFETAKTAIEPIRNVMEKDYAAIIRRKLDDVYRGSAHGGGQRNEKNERESFIVRITNFECYTKF